MVISLCLYIFGLPISPKLVVIEAERYTWLSHVKITWPVLVSDY